MAQCDVPGCTGWLHKQGPVRACMCRPSTSLPWASLLPCSSHIQHGSGVFPTHFSWLIIFFCGLMHDPMPQEQAGHNQMIQRVFRHDLRLFCVIKQLWFELVMIGRLERVLGFDLDWISYWNIVWRILKSIKLWLMSRLLHWIVGDVWRYREASWEVLESFCETFETSYWETLIQGLSGKFFLYLFSFIFLILKFAHPMEIGLRPIHIFFIKFIYCSFFLFSCGIKILFPSLLWSWTDDPYSAIRGSTPIVWMVFWPAMPRLLIMRLLEFDCT